MSSSHPTTRVTRSSVRKSAASIVAPLATPAKPPPAKRARTEPKPFARVTSTRKVSVPTRSSKRVATVAAPAPQATTPKRSRSSAPSPQTPVTLTPKDTKHESSAINSIPIDDSKPTEIQQPSPTKILTTSCVTHELADQIVDQSVPALAPTVVPTTETPAKNVVTNGHKIPTIDDESDLEANSNPISPGFNESTFPILTTQKTHIEKSISSGLENGHQVGQDLEEDKIECDWESFEPFDRNIDQLWNTGGTLDVKRNFIAWANAELTLICKDDPGKTSALFSLPNNVLNWEPDNVSTFLTAVGFPRMAKLFLEQDIDGTALLLLSSEDILFRFKLAKQSAWKLCAILYRFRQTMNDVLCCKGRQPDGHNWKS